LYVASTFYQSASKSKLQCDAGAVSQGGWLPHLAPQQQQESSGAVTLSKPLHLERQKIIRTTRQQALASLFRYYQQQRGRRPRLLVTIDLTTLEKVGRFEKLGLVCVFNKKRGLHVVVMYLVAGPLRFP